MAASDPTTDVPTPTGTLQGVAAFSWDGANWQPAGRAGPSVATPTGVLRGVAAFTGGPAWQPSGQAQPGVATPTGVLDGVAVYTWSGTAWTPPGGTSTPSTPSGALRGVAAFNWDGAVWQPAAQAGPSVATPTGVLDGVAMFNWNGSAWAAASAIPPGVTLDLSFMTPGTLDPRLTFTRGSTATYFDATGTMQTAAVNAPRWDYNPSTLALNGLLLEEARTNSLFPSGDLGAAGWAPSTTGASSVPVVTSNNVNAPDGTLTAARIVMPAVAAGANGSWVAVNSRATASAQATFSIWLRGAAGGETVNFFVTNFTTYFHTTVTLSTAWRRVSLVVTPTGGGWTLAVGADLRDATQTATSAQTFYAWGAQAEAGAFSSSYIPTTSAAVTRSADACSMPTNVSWFSSTASSLFAEYMVTTSLGAAPTGCDACGLSDGTTANKMVIRALNAVSADALFFSTIAGTSTLATAAGVLSSGVPAKFAAMWNGTAPHGVINGGVVHSYSSALPAGINVLAIGNQIPGGTAPLNGYIRRVRYWPRALSDAEMQQVTT